MIIIEHPVYHINLFSTYVYRLSYLCAIALTYDTLYMAFNFDLQNFLKLTTYF